VNPLYLAERDGDRVKLRLHFPSDDYADEYGACRRYLPEQVSLPRAALAALSSGRAPEETADLVRRHVIVDLPKLYY
jgi:hypothetical protein